MYHDILQTGLKHVGLPETRRCDRECFLRRLIFAWCGCFTFVTPVVIYSLWDLFSDWTRTIAQ